MHAQQYEAYKSLGRSVHKGKQTIQGAAMQIAFDAF